MKKIILTLYALALSTALVGCQNGKAEDISKVEDAPVDDSIRIICMGTDDTGSYKLWDQAKDIAGRIVMQLAPGDIFYFRKITAASYTDECTVFRLEIPRLKEADFDNPFDRKAKKIKKAFEFHVQNLKRQAIQRISNLKPSGAKNTDIFGFLAVASEKISLADKKAKPILIIATDLQDNVRFQPDLDLLGANIAIVGFQVMDDPKKTQGFKKKWRDHFNKAGAKHTLFIRAEEKFDLNRL